MNREAIADSANTSARARPQEDPLFASTHGAIKFALNYSHGTLKVTALAQSLGGRAGRGLVGIDGAAQAGMIQVELGRLLPVHRMLVIGRLALPNSTCSCGHPCCRGWRENPDWAEAVDWLTGYVLDYGLGGTISHYRLRRALVMRYFGVRDNLADIAKACGVNRDTASDFYKRVSAHFKAKEITAFTATRDLLAEGNIIET